MGGARRAGVVLNKDGSFQRSLAFRGPDLESATDAELVAACARANNVLKRFGSGWALHFEAERRKALGYPDNEFPDAASWLVDQERRAVFEAAGQHFESSYYLTLTFVPPPDQANTAGRALVECSDDMKGRDWRQVLAGFVADRDGALDLFSGFMPEVRDRASLDPHRNPNSQLRKNALVGRANRDDDINPHALVQPVSPWKLHAGSIIAASRITGLNSNLPGLVTAQVTENVYDSVTEEPADPARVAADREL